MSSSPEGSSADGSVLELRYLTASDEQEAVLAHRELAVEGFDFLLDHTPGTDWSEYLAGLERERLGVDLREGRVAASYLVAEVAGGLVGRVSIRHTLNPFLRSVGGHIGYAVRPRFRRRGFATRILELSLVRAHELGIQEALVTCDADNIGSRTVIERCGGILDPLRERISDRGEKLRYWIPTASRSDHRPPSS